MANDVDSRDFDNKIKILESRYKQQNTKALSAIAEEVLRLSGEVVPIDTGGLQNSSHVEKVDANDFIVGYNKVYAAYQHEGMRADGSHVVRHYSNPRSKRKFLEGPIKANLSVFQEYYRKVMSQMF